LAVEPAGRAPGPQQGLLDQVLGVVHGTQHPVAVRQQLAAERIRLAGEILTDGNRHFASLENTGPALPYRMIGHPPAACPHRRARATAHTYLPRAADSSFRGAAR